MAVEVTVILKDSERTYRQKFLCHETICIEPREAPYIDPSLLSYVQEAEKNFQGEPEDIIIRTTYVYK